MNKPNPYENAVPELRLFVSEFIENRNRDLLQVEAALENSDFTTLGRLGHTLKGMCAPYGLSELGVLGAELEQTASQKDGDNCRRICSEMKNLLNAVNQIPRP